MVDIIAIVIIIFYIIGLKVQMKGVLFFSVFWPWATIDLLIETCKRLPEEEEEETTIGFHN